MFGFEEYLHLRIIITLKSQNFSDILPIPKYTDASPLQFIAVRETLYFENCNNVRSISKVSRETFSGAIIDG